MVNNLTIKVVKKCNIDSFAKFATYIGHLPWLKIKVEKCFITSQYFLTTTVIERKNKTNFVLKSINLSQGFFLPTSKNWGQLISK